MKDSVSTTIRATAALAALLALAACGGGASGPGTQTAAAPPPAAGSSQINPLPRDQVQDGGTLTYPLNGMPSNFNYNQLDGTEQNGFYIIEPIMPEVYRTDASATPLWNPDILASEPVLVTEPRQVVTYEINPKAIWYDGTPITWEDFYWQWKASNGSDPAYQIAGSNGYKEIANVERGKDDREVIVTYANKYADWQNVFNPFYPASTNKDPKVFNEGWKNGLLTSAGPFRFESLNPTTKTITIVRNEKWWGQPAKLDSIVYRVIDQNAQIDALANGEIDLMDIGPDANTFNRAKALEGIELREAGGPNFRHLTMNGASPVLQDVRVRRALAMGIDRAAIARTQLTPLGIQATPLGNHIFMTNQKGYQDNSGEVGTYDPQKAAALLDEAGWTLQDGTRMKAGMPLEIRFIIPSGVPTSRQESELVQNMLGQLGVKVTIQTVPSDDFFDQYVSPGQYDFTVFSWMGTSFPISSSRSIYAKPVRAAGGQLEIQQNYARIGSDEIDKLFDAAAQELDPQKAIGLANQADAAIWREVHSLTLYQRPEIYACRTGLANYGAFGFGTTVWQDIGWAKP